MGRTESTAAAKQQGEQSAADQQAAQAANAQTQQTVGQYKGALANYMANDPYQSGGEFDKTIKTLGASVSQGEENSAEGAQNSAAARMGVSSSPLLAANTDEMRRSSTRSLGNYLANAEQDRIAKENEVQKFGVEGALAPASTQANLYGTSISGATGTGANQVSAAKTPGFWDTFAPALAQGAGAAAAGICPCEGSLILMADGSERPVEELKEGDYLWPLSTSAAPNRVLATPRAAMAECYEMSAGDTLLHRGSATHTVALAIGGYAFLPELEGKVVLAGLGTALVSAVRKIGEKAVYPLKIDGSHIYRADGIWVLA